MLILLYLSMHGLQVLQVFRLPARLTVEEAGALLGFHPDSIRFLVQTGLLNPLGKGIGVQLMFATAYIRRLHCDEKWLGKATTAVQEHHRERNAAQAARRFGRGKARIEPSNPNHY